MSKLNRQFFNCSTVLVAKELLGKYLCRRLGNKIIRAKITETEAYCGEKDKACHASKGLTPRTKVMFGPPGYAYIYMIYGMYHCLNVVTREEGCPEAVLIRGAETISPKYEIRSTKQSPKIRNLKPETLGNFKNSNLELVSNFDIQISNLKLNGPGKLCRELKIDKKLNGVDITKSKELWIESVSWRKDDIVKPPQIKKGKRVGIDYAGKWKNKLWRFYILS